MPELTEADRQILIYEGEQSWEHYRHVENQRNTFVGVLLTIAIAAIGLMASLSLRNGRGAEDLAFAVSCPLACAVMSMGLIVYWSVQRFEHILYFYQQVMIHIRDTLAVSVNLNRLGIDLNVMKHIPPQLSGRFKSPHSLATSSSIAVITIFGLVPIVAVVSNVWIRTYDLPEELCIAFCVTYAVFLSGCLLLAQRSIRRSQPDYPIDKSFN
jgi:hypothetical protein